MNLKVLSLIGTFFLLAVESCPLQAQDFRYEFLTDSHGNKIGMSALNHANPDDVRIFNSARNAAERYHRETGGFLFVSHGATDPRIVKEMAVRFEAEVMVKGVNPIFVVSCYDGPCNLPPTAESLARELPGRTVYGINPQHDAVGIFDNGDIDVRAGPTEKSHIVVPEDKAFVRYDSVANKNQIPTSTPDTPAGVEYRHPKPAQVPAPQPPHVTPSRPVPTVPASNPAAPVNRPPPGPRNVPHANPPGRGPGGRILPKVLPVLSAADLLNTTAHSGWGNAGNLAGALLSGQGDPNTHVTDYIPFFGGNLIADLVYGGVSNTYDFFWGEAKEDIQGNPNTYKPEPPPPDDWGDFVRGLKCLTSIGCVGGLFGFNSYSWGDPHIVTGDGLHYDFQAAGEFVLIETGDRLIHIRQQPFRTSTQVSVNTALATKLGSDRVGVYATPRRVMLNGENLDSSVQLSEGSVEVIGSKVVISWTGGDAVTVQWREDRIDLSLQLGAQHRGTGRGLLGNLDGDPNNDLALVSGVVLALPVPYPILYGEFADDWRIDAETSLFDYQLGESTDTFQLLGFPGQHFSVGSLSAAQREQATAACQAAGVTDPILFDACILDVGLTGDVSFATSAAKVPVPKISTEFKSEYLGCFVDQAVRDLDSAHIFRRNMTVAMCHDFCVTRGSIYFSLQAREHCFCGDQYGRYGPSSETECSLPCGGNINENCGGLLRNSIYQTAIFE